MGNGEGFKERVTRQGEETIGKLAQEVLENPVVTGTLSRLFEARERAVRAQEVAMGALNLPSASDLERLTRRVRSVSQRLEGIEDGVDRLDDRLQRPAANRSLEDRLMSIERTLERLEAAQAPAAGDAPATINAPSRAAEDASADTDARPQAADSTAADTDAGPQAPDDASAATDAPPQVPEPSRAPGPSS
jgi:predicted  nucleic acid-binding Zn-ribbon protein